MSITKHLNIKENCNNYNTRGPRSNPSNPVNILGAGEQSSPPPFKFLERLMIFIDGENLFQFSRENKIKIDFGKLVCFLSGGYHLIRVYYYTGIPTQKLWRKEKESKKQFESKLNKQLNFLEINNNIEVIKKPLSLSNGKISEKGVDVKIASDIIWHGLSDNYDFFILLSGDKDLMDCLIRMKDNGKRVIVANFEGKISREMKKLADKYINLSEHLEEIKK
jgi:uncharacterized LabA/DUF88 family protein